MKFYARTRIEWIILIAVFIVFVIVAIPTYLHFSVRMRFHEIVAAAKPYKASITQCYKSTGTLIDCNGGSHFIPPNVVSKSGPIASLTVTSGVITITPTMEHGILTTDTYVLTPAVKDNNLVWTASGGGVSKGYIKG